MIMTREIKENKGIVAFGDLTVTLRITVKRLRRLKVNGDARTVGQI
jgi:hypothetical protein